MRKYFLLTIFLTLISCTTNVNVSQRVNPSPPPIPTESVKPKSNVPDIFLNTEFEDLKPLEPEQLDLAKNDYEIEIKFDVVLGRVSIDEGEIKEVPAKYKLKGGYHKMILFDLVTGCQIRKVITIDKNGPINFKKEDEC